MTQRQILIVGPAWVGDMVMAQCLFKLLKQDQVPVQIDVLAPEWTLPLLSRMPEVHQAIALPVQHGEFKWRTRYRLAQQLRAHQYEQAIVLPNSFKSALIPWLARIPKRTGWLGEGRYVLLNDIRCRDQKRYPLLIEQWMALALSPDAALPASYPLPELAVSSSVTIQGRQPILALCAGAAFGPAKRWPADYFAQVARQKKAEGWRIWLFGSSEDRPVIEAIMSLAEGCCEDLSGRFGLAQVIDWLSLVTGVVTNDSGLMHMAAALKKPLVALYGATSPAFTPPLSATATILQLDLACQPCFARTCPRQHHRCMRDLMPDRVLAAIDQW